MAVSAPPSTSPRSPLAPLRALLHGLRTRRTRTQEDRALAHHLYTAFERPGTSSYKGLHFQVFDGVVTVFGSVGDEEDREAIFGRIAVLPGVRAVSDHLQVETVATRRSYRMN